MVEIGFCGGPDHSLVVDDSLANLFGRIEEARLSQGGTPIRGWFRSKNPDGADVFIQADNIAYLRDIPPPQRPSRRPWSWLFSRRPSPGG